MAKVPEKRINVINFSDSEERKGSSRKPAQYPINLRSNMFKYVVSGALLTASLAFSANSLNIGGGLNLSSTNTKEESGVTLSNKVGFNAGVDYQLGITDMFSVAPGVSLETRGQKFSADFFGTSVEGSFNLLYLQIPVHAVVSFPVGTMMLNIGAGPELGIKLSASSEVNGTDGGDPEVKPIDFGVSADIGLDIPMGNGAIFVQPGYYLGLLNTDDSTPAAGEPDPDTKNRNIKIKVGYKLHI
jgi:hypothetical protein